jgi:hypothetical protein
MGSLALEVSGEAFRLELPPSTGEDVASVFLAGLPKAGSTLLNRLMRPIPEAAGLAFYALPEELRSLGVRPADFPAELIPTPTDQNPCAHSRRPMDMMRHGWSVRRFQWWQQWSTMSS